MERSYISKESENKKVLIFSKKLEQTLNSYISIPTAGDPNKTSKGYYLKISSVNGLKMYALKNKSNLQFIRLNISFFFPKTKQFFGNTIISDLLEVKQLENYFVDITDPVYSYFFAPLDTKNSVLGVVEINFIETTTDKVIVKQSCEGWSLLDIKEKVMEKRQESANIYSGSGRFLFSKSVEELIVCQGCSLAFELVYLPELDDLKHLLPPFYLVNYLSTIPGLIKPLPANPEKNSAIYPFEKNDIYLKSICIKLNEGFENRLLSYMNKYRNSKFDLGSSQSQEPIAIKERKLKCALNNSLSFINQNGVNNSINMFSVDGLLEYKGIVYLNNYFSGDNCGIYFELIYSS